MPIISIEAMGELPTEVPSGDAVEYHCPLDEGILGDHVIIYEAKHKQPPKPQEKPKPPKPKIRGSIFKRPLPVPSSQTGIRK